MNAGRRAVLMLGLVVTAQLVWGGQYIYRSSFVHQGERVFSLWDDAMISMQYGRNLRLGEGLVWTAGGERVQGYTNLGVTLIMAAFHLLPIPSTRTSLAVQVLALAMLGATLILVWGLARRLFRERPEREWIALGSALATALCAPLAIWSLQGSDVGFVTLWLVGAVFVLAGPAPRTPQLLAVAALGLWIRPDTAIFFPLLLAAAGRVPGGNARRLGLGVAVFAGTLAAQVAFSQLYYGDPLPNTYYLKATGSPRALMLASGFRELIAWLPQLALPIGLAVVSLRAERRNPIVLLCAALFAVAQAYNCWVGGDFIFGYGSRFAVPVLPFLMILAVAGCWRALERFTPERIWRSRAGVGIFLVACALVAVICNPPKSSLEWFDPTASPMHRDSNRNNFNFARYLRDYTDPTTILGAHWGGVPVYFSGRPAIDLLGKSDRHIARLEVDRFIPGHSKWDWDYVLEKRAPDVFRGASRGLGDRPDFRRSYYKVETTHGLSFFLRRDSLAKLIDHDVVLVDLVTGRKTRRSGPAGPPRRGRGPS